MKLDVSSSGYIAVWKDWVEFSHNMVKFPDEILLMEIVRNQKYCSVMIHNHVETIKNKKIYDKSLYDFLPGIFVGKRYW